MPATKATFSGSRFNSAAACWRAAKTPKSPQPGHHQEAASVRKSFTVRFFVTVDTLQDLPAVSCDFLGQERRTVVLGEAAQFALRHVQMLSQHQVELPLGRSEERRVGKECTVRR